MKFLNLVFASLFFLFLTCAHEYSTNQIEVSSGSAELTIKLGTVGSIARNAAIELDSLFITLTAPGETPIVSKSAINGTSQQTIIKTFSNLASLKTWTVTAVSKDKAGKTIHSGTTTFVLQPHGTVSVTLDLASQYSMLKASFFPIRDSVNEVRLWVDGVIVRDSLLGKARVPIDTVTLSFDYLAAASPAGIQHAIRMDARGSFWGEDTLLYRGDTTITVVSGQCASYAIKLKCLIPNPPPGMATMTVVLGAIGSVTINGQLEDKLNKEIKEIFMVNKEASEKIHEWLRIYSIDETRNKLVQFLNLQANVKNVITAEDGSVVSVEYMNGLQAVALFGKPGTLSYPGNDEGITVSVSVDTNMVPGGWVYRDAERIDVYNKVSSGTAINSHEMHDMTFTLNRIRTISDYGFIHIASHGGIHPFYKDQFFLSGDSLPYNDSAIIRSDWCDRHQDTCKWWDSCWIFPELVSEKWAVRPAFIENIPGSFPGSLVILSFCKSMENSAMYNAFLAKHAASVVGWKDTIDTAFAREAIQILMTQMVDSAKTLGVACHFVNSFMANKYPLSKDSLCMKGDSMMQLTFRLNTTVNPSGGGTITRSRDAAAYKYGETVTLTAVPALGYKFTGWTGDTVTSNSASNITCKKNVSLTAHFMRQYSVNFNSQGGSAVAAQMVDYGSYATAPAAPTKTDYTFVGWFKEAGGVNAWVFASEQVTTDVTLYAKWTITFEKTFGGAFTDQGFSVIQTIDGGYMIAGRTYSFKPGGSEVYMIKTDSICNTQWIKTFGNGTYNEGNAVQQTPDKGYIIAGTQTVIFSNSVILTKTDDAGNIIWTKNLGRGFGENVLQTSDGGYAVIGSTDEQNVLLIKTDEVGNTTWSKTYGYCIGEDVKQTADGGYVIVGFTSSESGSGWGIYLVKTDTIGNTQWSKVIGGSVTSGGRAIYQTPDGGFIIAGYSSGICLIKTSADGIVQWKKTYGGDWFMTQNFQTTSDSGYIVVGSTSSEGAGLSDVYLIKTDGVGNTQWTKTFGGTASDDGYSVQQTNDGGYIVVGSTESFGQGDDDVYIIKTDKNGNVH